MSALHLTQDQARAFLLERQYLIQPTTHPLDVPRRLTAIQAQYGVSVPVAIFSRSLGANLAWVDDALAKSHSIVKTWCMRGTLHAVAADDLALLMGSIGQRGIQRMRRHLIDNRGYTEESLEALNREMLAHLDEPITRQELHRRVPALKDLTWAGWGEDLKLLVYHGLAVFATPKDGTTSCFVRRDVWLPTLEWSLDDYVSARRQLLRRYLTAHAPARIADYTYWSSLPAVETRADFAALKDELLTLKIDDRPDTYYALVADEARLRDPLSPVPLNILPKFDSLVLAHRDKSLTVEMAHHKRIFRKAGQIEAVILLNGKTAGAWRLKHTAKQLEITVEPFRKFNAREMQRISTGFERLAAFYGAPVLSLTFREL